MINETSINPTLNYSHASLKESTRKVAFLIEGNPKNNDLSISLNSHLYEGQYIAEANRSSYFDCIHSFDNLHLSTFLSGFPPVLHKRIAFQIIRIFLYAANIDDLLNAFIRPIVMDIINPESIYREPFYQQMPGWVEELTSERIFDTVASFQKELGGFENLQNEFKLIKRKLLGCGNEISLNKFREYLDQNTDITEVCGFVRQVHLYFLDYSSTIHRFTDTERHLTFHHKDRHIAVHLFGTDDTEAYLDGMRLFTLEQKLKIPYGHFEDTSVEPDPEDNFKNISKAYDQFKRWWDKYEHIGNDSEELAAWFCEDEESDKYIKTHHDLALLAMTSRSYGFNCDDLPNEKTFESFMALKKAKRLQSLKNTNIFNKDASLEISLENSKIIFDYWMNSTSQIPTDKKRKLSFLEVCNLGMDLFLSTKRRREKWWLKSQPKSTQKIQEPQTQVEKIIYSYATSLVDLLPVSDELFSASQLSAALKQYLDVIRLSQEALANYKKLDPLVGENACQIRAAMFTEILNKPCINDEVNSTLARLREHARDVEALLNRIPDKKGQIATLKSFLVQNEAFFDISEDIAVIITSHILTENKTIETRNNKNNLPVRVEKIPADIFSKTKGLSGRFAASLIKLTQTRLSELSVIYVQRIALRMLVDRTEKTAAVFAFNRVKVDEYRRKSMPFYHTMRLLLTELFKNKVPLVLRVKQMIIGHSKHYGKLTLIFENKGKDKYSASKLTLEHLGRGAIFFHAKSMTDKMQPTELLREKFLMQPVEEYILSASADHPQEEMNDESFWEYRRKAHEWGTCHDNPSLFMVQHVCYKPNHQRSTNQNDNQLKIS